MTVAGLLVLLLRWRYATVAGVLLTVAAVFSVHQLPGVYYARTTARFLPPVTQSEPNQNSLVYTPQTLISTAGVISQQLARESKGSRTASSAVTLAGQGVRHGWSVTLPNSGGQWAFNFAQPVLQIEAVGADETEVQELMADAVGKVQQRLDGLQSGIPDRGRITVQFLPPTPSVIYDQGHRSRAYVITLLLGLGLTLAAVMVLDLGVARGLDRRFLGPDPDVPEPELADDRNRLLQV